MEFFFKKKTPPLVCKKKNMPEGTQHTDKADQKVPEGYKLLVFPDGFEKVVKIANPDDYFYEGW